MHYLLRVLEGAARAVRPGGAIFVGDLRSFPLLEAFHASVQLHQATPDTTKLSLWHRVQQRLRQEHELVVDPALFGRCTAGFRR